MDSRLSSKILSCPTLPSLPALAVQVLELAQKADVDIAEIARIISKDPALSSKILKTVNSSFYGRSKNVSTISQALVILGLQSVKTLVLGFSLVNNLSKTKSTAFQHLFYWKRSIFAATAARVLAVKTGSTMQEEAFLAALLMDLGMLVLDLVLPDQYGDVYVTAKTHDTLAAVETEALSASHGEVGGMLAQHWKLPPLLHLPITNHHSPDRVSDPTVKSVARLVALAGRCADVYLEADPSVALTAVRQMMLEYYQIDEAGSDALMTEIGTKTKEVASLFEINLGATQNFEVVLKKANETLIEMTLQSQQQTSELQVQNKQLIEKATRDGLTGLANRATFDETFAELFAAARTASQPISVLMFDLDKFKSVNDKFGHPAGDAVLRAAAKILIAASRKGDVAARYGGEEMLMVLPNTQRQQAAATAEAIRRALEARPVQAGTAKIPVTVSIGVATFVPGSPFREPAHLLKAADLALYNAKHSGRNQVKLFSLPTPPPAAAKLPTAA